METSLKRIIAYLVDVLLISLVLFCITSVFGLDPYEDKYNDTYDRYEEIVEELEEDETLDYTDELIEINYNLSKYQLCSNIYNIALYILYFGVLQFMWHGQTLGKKLMKIQIVSNNDKSLNFGNYLVRLIILNGVLFRVINMVAIFFASANTFYYISYATSLVESAIYIAIILMITLKKDGRGLHDLCANTKVIDLNPVVNIKEDNTSKKDDKKGIDTKEEKSEKVSIKEKADKKTSVKKKAKAKE